MWFTPLWTGPLKDHNLVIQNASERYQGLACCPSVTLKIFYYNINWKTFTTMKSRAARLDRRSLRSCRFLDSFPIISDPRFLSVRSGIGRFFFCALFMRKISKFLQIIAQKVNNNCIQNSDWLTSINPENQRTNTEIVAILIWFLGTYALPFCFSLGQYSLYTVTHVQHR